ncbi:MAG: hypothetical protein KIT87_16615 [Anaerolineae bacterium]|nr:hypothetical protein [Anaerolineae bacterium]
MADKPQPPREDETSLIPSFMRHSTVSSVPDRQTFEELRTLQRRRPSRLAAWVAALVLFGLLLGLGVGAWTLLGRNQSIVKLATDPTPDLPPPLVVLAPTNRPQTETSAPTPDLTNGAGAIPLPPGRQPRDLITPEPSPLAAIEAMATPAPVATTLVATSPPVAKPTEAVPTRRATDSGPAVVVMQRPNGLPIKAPRLAGSGLRSIADLQERLDRAGAAPVAVDSPVFGAASWQGAQDLSGQLWTGWDAANLYLLARVTDDVFVQEATGILLYQGDSIELQFDADLAGDFTSRVYNDDDWQIGLSPGNLVGPSPQWQWWVYRGNPGAGAIQIQARLETDGYTLAAALPWSLLRTEPRQGMTYGFALNINDNDTPGTKQQKSMVSTSPVRQLNDPTSWGTLQLTGAAQ